VRISIDKIISLLFFVLSAFYLHQTYQIQVFSFDENAPFNAKTFPTVLDYRSSLYLVIITVIYGFVILRAGFFLSTSFFLFFSYYFLGERRWIWMFVLSFPFVALFMYLLHGILNVYLRDPLLKMLGIMG
jgi:putative tricarboxylic transport membrane protein